MERRFLVAAARGRTKEMKRGSEGKKESGRSESAAGLVGRGSPSLPPSYLASVRRRLQTSSFRYLHGFRGRERNRSRSIEEEEEEESGTVCPVAVTLPDFAGQTRLVAHVRSCIFQEVRSYMTEMAKQPLVSASKTAYWFAFFAFLKKRDHSDGRAAKLRKLDVFDEQKD